MGHLAAGRFAWRCSALLPAGIARAQTPAGEEARRHPQGPRAQEEGARAAARGHPAPPAGDSPRRAGKRRAAPGGATGKQKGASKSAAPAGPAAPSFGRAVHPLFVTTCKPCHAPGAPGGVSRLLLSGDAAADHKVIARFVNAARSGGERAAWQGLGRHHPRGRRALARGRRAVPAGAGVDSGRRASRCSREGGARAGGGRRGAARRSAVAAPPAAHRRRPQPAAPCEPAHAPAPPPQPRSRGPHPDPLPQAGEGERSAKPGAPRFAATVHPVLMSACAVCHRPGAPAAMTRLVALRRCGARRGGRPAVRGRAGAGAEPARHQGRGARCTGAAPCCRPGDPRLGGDRRLGEGARRRRGVRAGDRGRRAPHHPPRRRPRRRRHPLPPADTPRRRGLTRTPARARPGSGFRSGSCSTAVSTSPTSAGSSRAARSRRRA